MDKNFILENAYVGMRPVIGPERASRHIDLVKVKLPAVFEDIEGYVFVKVTGDTLSQLMPDDATIARADNNEKVDPKDMGDFEGAAMLSLENAVSLGLDIDELIERAKANTAAATKVRAVAEELGMEPIGPSLLVVSTTVGQRGAGALVNPSVVFDAAARYGIGDKVWALPSSVDEWLLYPYTSEDDYTRLGMLINDVNDSCVHPQDVLGIRPYLLDRAELAA